MAGKSQNIAHKILASHLVGVTMTPGREIQLKVDHLLMQDATSTLTMLALESMELDRIKIDLACHCEIMLVGGFSVWIRAKNDGTPKEKAVA